jgi:Ion channel
MRKNIDDLLAQRGSICLMWVLVAVTVASPIADTYPHIGAALALLVLLSVLMGARLSANRRIVVWLVLPTAGLWILARLLEGLGNRPHLYNLLAHLLGLALSCSILWAIFERLGTPQVTAGVIAEAFISYLMIAIAFSQLYWLLNELITDGFNQKISSTNSSEFLYFSMITITSVGYGGIIPVNPFVRIIAAFESMIGIFYVALVVARLVSLYRPVRGDANSGR